MASDVQKLKQLRDEAKRRGKLRQAKSGLLYKSELTELDRLHLTRSLLPSALKRVRHDLETWAQIEARPMDPETEPDLLDVPTMTKDELLQFEGDMLTAYAELDEILGSTRVLISGRTFSEPQGK